MRENKFEKILAAAAHLISKKGYSGTSFQEIANDVGIHKSTLFHYFKNKEDVLLRILERSIEEVCRNLEQITANDALGPLEKLEKAIHNHLALLLEYFDNVNVYLNEFRSLSEKNQALYLQKRKKYEQDFQKIVLEMKKLGYFEGLDTKIVTFGILGMLNWTAKWHRKDGALSIEDIARVFYGMITQKHRDNREQANVC